MRTRDEDEARFARRIIGLKTLNLQRAMARSFVGMLEICSFASEQLRHLLDEYQSKEYVFVPYDQAPFCDLLARNCIGSAQNKCDWRR